MNSKRTEKHLHLHSLISTFVFHSLESTIAKLMTYEAELPGLSRPGQKPKSRAVEIPCHTSPTWSHFIQDKLKISINLTLDKNKYIKLKKILYFIF